MPSIPESAWQAGSGAVDDALVGRPLMTLVEAAVRRDPEAPAVAGPDRVLTYRQIWNAAIALAGDIAASTRPGDRVGIRLPAGLEHAVAIVACLAASRIAVLLDMADPPARTAAVLGAAGAGFALGESNLAGAGAVRWRAMDRLDAGGALRPALPPMGVHGPAYIVTTSGSSGVPKLIVHSQHSLSVLVHGNVALARQGPADRNVFTGSAGSAAAVHHLYQSLVSGGRSLLCDIRSHGVSRFMDLLQDHGATTLRIFPSLARILAALPRAGSAFARQRFVRLIGEPMLASDLALLRGVLPRDAAIVNSYGSSETLGFDWFAPPGAYAGGTVVPAGVVRAGAAFVLLDEEGKPCPPGVAGELVIRSRYNTMGEWRDGHCVPGRMEPAGPDGLAIYRTGDLAVVGADGMLTVLGRADRQVKVNGNRIELSEIEEAMRGIPGIAAAAVVARREPGRTTLFGFFVAAPGAPDVAPADLRRGLAGRLPAAMLPARLIAIDSLPTLPGFKLDTASLLARVAGDAA